MKPERIVLENVSGMKAHGCLDIAVEHMAKELPDYTITHFEFSPNMFGVCLLRPRIYFVGVKTNVLPGITKDQLLHFGRVFIAGINKPVGADFITFLSPAPQNPRSNCVTVVRMLRVSCE